MARSRCNSGNADATANVYAGSPQNANSSVLEPLWEGIVQSAHPRDVEALVLVLGMFLVLFVVSVMLGAPTR